MSEEQISKAENPEFLSVAEEIASIYEADELAYLSGLQKTASRSHIYSQFFSDTVRSLPVPPENKLHLYYGIQKAKDIRSQLGDTSQFARYLGMRFAGQFDRSPYTVSLLTDVLITKLINPASPSSSSIVNALDQMRTELGGREPGKPIDTIYVVSRILNGDLRMSPTQPAQ